MTVLTMRRNGVLAQIQNNPFYLDLRRPTSTAAPGSGAPRLGAPYTTVATNRQARVARKSKSVLSAGQSTPQQTGDSWFLLTDYKTHAAVGDQFEDGESNAWEVAEVTALVKYSGVIGYECTLEAIDAIS